MQTDWEIWLDVHISPVIAKWMAEHTGYTVKSSYLLDLSTMDDFSIYQKAKSLGNIILVSKDTDKSIGKPA
jgi:predicted nuclease of predicted toxin-antitoxin system